MPPQAKAARRSLADLAATSPPLAGAAGPMLDRPPETTGPTANSSQVAPNTRARYPSATVYLPPRAIRLLKEIGLEENRRLTDILAESLDEWLVRKGHPSLKQLGQ
jgi:hypothetical protein